MRLLPALALEPPPRYVAFVATHLDPLRDEAASVVGGEDDAAQLYPEVLTDVALRWRWLELARALLRRPDTADSYLRRAFVRRSRRWRAEQDELLVEPGIEVWTADEVWTVRPPRPVRSSGATRLATFVRPAPSSSHSVIAEAAVAWWHAYEAHRRHRLVATLVAVFLVAGLIWQVGGATGV